MDTMTQLRKVHVVVDVSDSVIELDVACRAVLVIGVSSVKVTFLSGSYILDFFFFQAEDGIRDYKVTGVQTCALPISFFSSRRLPGHGYARSHSAASGLSVAGRGLARSSLCASHGRSWRLRSGGSVNRSGERRVGEEGRSRGVPDP